VGGRRAPADVDRLLVATNTPLGAIDDDDDDVAAAAAGRAVQLPGH
jgi:hypothetical protein